mmetsp:Transcript_36427/g.88204  ORF Transcript_36427/g.88204 Transcript_36427/m.88204 type:complete len:207 (+) Transcript_36427:2417-3037(+)
MSLSPQQGQILLVLFIFLVRKYQERFTFFHAFLVQFFQFLERDPFSLHGNFHKVSIFSVQMPRVLWNLLLSLQHGRECERYIDEGCCKADSNACPHGFFHSNIVRQLSEQIGTNGRCKVHDGNIESLDISSLVDRSDCIQHGARGKLTENRKWESNVQCRNEGSICAAGDGINGSNEHDNHGNDPSNGVSHNASTGRANSVENKLR